MTRTLITSIFMGCLILLIRPPSSPAAIVVTPLGGSVAAHAKNTFGTWDADEDLSPGLSGSLNASAPAHPSLSGDTTASTSWSISSSGASASATLGGFQGYSFATAGGQVNYFIAATGTLRYQGFINGIEVSGTGNPFPSGLTWRAPPLMHAWATSDYQMKTSVVWTDEPAYPGEEPENPLIASTFVTEDKDSHSGDDADDGADLAEDIAATNLTSFPAMGTYGYDEPVYLQFPQLEYVVTSWTPMLLFSENAFTSLTIPGIFGGGDFELRFKSQSHTVSAGTTIDLTAFSTSDVHYMHLWSSSPGIGVPPVLGFTFADEGITDVLQAVYVPEPSTMVLACFATLGLLAVARRRALQTTRT